MPDDDPWIKAERAHERDMADLKFRDDRYRREQRTERIVAVCVAFGIVGSLAVLAALIYFWQESAGERGRKVEEACIAAGGTWTVLGGGTGKAVCVRVSELPQ